MSEENPYKIAYNREKRARKEAESILEEKSRELYQSNVKLNEFNKSLGSIIEKRTKELTKAKEEAENLARVKTEFISMLSHEIKNPLNAVIGYSELLSLELTAVSSIEYLKRIQSSSRILLGIIEDILIFSRADSGKIDINVSEFNIKEELYACIEMFEQKALSKGLEIIVNCPDIKIKSDKQKIAQVLINLIGNALKFTDEGKIEVSLDKNNGVLSCKVDDTGYGISEEDITKLFEPFMQVGDQKRFKEGTGLGLTITRKMINVLGGTISVRSKIDVGSSFSFEIPLQS